MISQGSFTRGFRTFILIKAKKLLIGIWQKATEHLSRGQVRIQLRRLGNHAQSIVFPTHLHALAASLAKVADKNRKDTSITGILLLYTPVDSSNIVICQRELIYDLKEFITCLNVDLSKLTYFRTQNILERFLGLRGDILIHFCAATLIQPCHLIK